MLIKLILKIIDKDTWHALGELIKVWLLQYMRTSGGGDWFSTWGPVGVGIDSVHEDQWGWGLMQYMRTSGGGTCTCTGGGRIRRGPLPHHLSGHQSIQALPLRSDLLPQDVQVDADPLLELRSQLLHLFLHMNYSLRQLHHIQLKIEHYNWITLYQSEWKTWKKEHYNWITSYQTERRTLKTKHYNLITSKAEPKTLKTEHYNWITSYQAEQRKLKTG